MHKVRAPRLKHSRITAVPWRESAQENSCNLGKIKGEKCYRGRKKTKTLERRKKKKCVTGLMSGIDRLTNRQTDNNNNITSVVSRATQEKNTLWGSGKQGQSINDQTRNQQQKRESKGRERERTRARSRDSPQPFRYSEWWCFDGIVSPLVYPLTKSERTTCFSLLYIFFSPPVFLPINFCLLRGPIKVLTSYSISSSGVLYISGEGWRFYLRRQSIFGKI